MLTEKQELLAELVDKTFAIGRSIGANERDIVVAFARGLETNFDAESDFKSSTTTKRRLSAKAKPGGDQLRFKV